MKRTPRFPLALDQLAPSRAAAPAAKPTSIATPVGLGLDSPAIRARMVERLRDEGIRCAPVLAAMAQVPRHGFVDAALAAQAYEDTALPIGHGQTISQPWVVARMIERLFEGRASATLGRVLEIGTGCGYQAAVLARVARSVVSIERLRPLFDRARDNLAPLRLNNVRLVYGDGRMGHAPNAPYDAIISAAGGEDIPPAWLEQLAVGGRLVAPLHEGGNAAQTLVTIERGSENGWSRQRHESVRFVPLRSGTA
jgi:protein-L-isoaspartate(D-aspartate) O-methyltransferase